MINAVTIGNNQDYSTNIEKRNYSTQFRANENNSLERMPAEDAFEKENDTVKKVAIGSAIVLGLAAAADGIFNHGKYLKKIFGKAEKAATEAKPETKPKAEPKVEPKVETHEVYFGRDKGKTGELFVYKDGKLTDQIDFCSDNCSGMSGDRICNWDRKDINPWEDEGLSSIYMSRDHRIEWHALPPKDLSNGLGLTNWTKIE